jgi:hypothetical protein
MHPGHNLRTSARPAYFLGRSADTWTNALDRHRRSVSVSRQTTS